MLATGWRAPDLKIMSDCNKISYAYLPISKNLTHIIVCNAYVKYSKIQLHKQAMYVQSKV